MGKNGVTVNGILHTPSSAPQQLYTQDFLQVGEQKFFFLLPKGTSRRRPPSASPPAYVSFASNFTPHTCVACEKCTALIMPMDSGFL